MVVVLDRVTSTTTLSNTASETTMYTYSVPANMGAKLGDVLDLEMILSFQNFSLADRTYTVRVKFGGTTHFTEALPAMASSGLLRPAVIRVRIQNTGASAQYIIATASVGVNGNDWSVAPLLAPAHVIVAGTIDQTAAQTLAVTLQSDAATATQTITTQAALLTLI